MGSDCVLGGGPPLASPLLPPPPFFFLSFPPHFYYTVSLTLVSLSAETSVLLLGMPCDQDGSGAR